MMMNIKVAAQMFAVSIVKGLLIIYLDPRSVLSYFLFGPKTNVAS